MKPVRVELAFAKGESQLYGLAFQRGEFSLLPRDLRAQQVSRQRSGAGDHRVDAGNVACVQLRLKHASRDELTHAIDVLRPPVQERNIAFVLNDDPKLASQTGCDGVHVGQEDTPYKNARAIMGGEGIVGVT